MNQEDLKQFSQIVEEKVNKTITDVLEQNLMPAMNELHEKIDRLEGRMDRIEGKMDKLEGTVANLPDKAYLTDKLADLAVEIFQRLDRKLEKENDFKKKVTEIIKRNKLGTAEEVGYLEGLIA